MARISRLVVPGYPHHVTQRGVRSIDLFVDDDDRRAYLDFLATEARRHGVTFLAWCLMTNHVHLLAIPASSEALARALGEAHRRYTRMRNFREGVRGYLLQGRFGSCVLDEQHLLAAGRYVERNPVKAGMAEQPWDYRWSSCRFHCGLAQSDPLIAEPLLPALVGDWRGFVDAGDAEADERLRRQTRTGRPVGDEAFVERLEVEAGRVLRPKAPGRPKRGGK